MNTAKKWKRPNEAIYFDFKEVKANLKAKIDQWNEKQECLPIGERKFIREAHYKTAEFICTMYARQLNVARTLQEIGQGRMPLFRTFNVSLEKALRVRSRRTILNHKKRLKEAGIITMEIHCGYNGIELAICPDIMIKGQKCYDLFRLNEEGMTVSGGKLAANEPERAVDNLPNVPAMPGQSPEKFSQKTDSGLTSPTDGQNLPPFVLEQPIQREKINRGVDKWKCSWSGDSSYGQEQEIRNNRDAESGSAKQARSEENPTGLATGTKNEKGSSAAPPPDPHLQKVLHIMLGDFWREARCKLYTGQSFTESQEERIKSRIKASVFLGFSLQLDFDGWSSFYKQQLKRVEMVRRFLERNPDNYVHEDPAVYFDHINSKNGFIKTEEWVIKAELSKIRREVNDWKKNGGQVKTTAVMKKGKKHGGGMKPFSPFDLYRRHERRLANFRDPHLRGRLMAGLQKLAATPGLYTLVSVKK